MTEHHQHGYVACGCYSCFDPAICCFGCGKDHDHHLCHACETAGCEGGEIESSNCQRDPEEDLYAKDSKAP